MGRGDQTVSSMGAAANLGAGISSRNGSWDARAVYSIFMGSDNASGAFLTAVGFSF